MLKVEVDFKDQVSPELARLIASLDDPTELNEAGGVAARDAAKDYHQEFNDANGWRGSNYLGPGANKSGEFGQNVSLGWRFDTSDATGAVISNNADYYAFKVSGGTVVPKRVSRLTIPLVEEAVGRRASDYEAYTDTRLFQITGKKALFETRDDGSLRAVYALVKQVVQQPWPKALPNNETLSEAFVDGFLQSLGDLLE